MPNCAFSSQISSTITLWRGNPDCQAGHDYLLNELCHFVSSFLPPISIISTRQQGNLGEFIALCIGKEAAYIGADMFPANAFDPLQDISKSDIDIIWLYISDDNPEDDFVVIQEVKTTIVSNLNYANTLVQDYDKLFDVNPQFTLNNRLQSLKNEVEFKLQKPHLCSRINAFAGISPQSCPRVKLVPTLIHDRTVGNPSATLGLIRSSLISKHWISSNVSAWSIALYHLSSRLNRLATGQS